MKSALTARLPDALKSIVGDYLDQYRIAGGLMTVLEDKRVAASLGSVWAVSDFVATSCIRDPALLQSLVATGALAETCAKPFVVDPDAPEPHFLKMIRRWRRREAIRIAWRDIAGWADLDETLGDLSELADTAIRAALEYQQQQMTLRHGEPAGTDGRGTSLIVLAMGKLGGRELNFSSDIDLIFLYPELGGSDGRKGLDGESWFRKLGQRLIHSLDTVTEDGFVFRVDMRLRPFGDSGPLTMSVPALEAYLQEHGREWERYAYIKARHVVAPENDDGLFKNVLRPFVYRKYLDYGVFESLRDMKKLISREVSRRDLKDNIKLGPGGIREIEFTVQSFQLIRGGCDPALQDRGLLSSLTTLTGQGLLPADQSAELSAAYRFLRQLENRLQAMHDRQTHELPVDVIECHRLAFAMGEPDWAGTLIQLNKHRDRVSDIFDQIVFGPPGTVDRENDGWAAFMESQSDSPDYALAMLADTGIADPPALLKLLDVFRSSPGMRRLNETGWRRLKHLLPHILKAVATVPDQELALRRLLDIIEAIGTRTAYLALLLENPIVLRRLTELCGLSRFLADQISTHPLLLDELIDPRVADILPDRDQFETELGERLAAGGSDDAERSMDALRHFQQAAVFRTALADLSGKLPVMKVSDRLTDIAELVLEAALAIARQHLSRKHGEPMAGLQQDQRPAGFAIIAYGKLGGIELGYGSDLDLVFVHDAGGQQQQTTGPAVLDNSVFFARLARRVVTLLMTQTTSGSLYKVDMRLRPSGHSGLLVSSLEAFASYQQEKAWTWEHQALLRARTVAGSEWLCQRFEAVRKQVLCRDVNRSDLKADVLKMRERMRQELGRGIPELFDIKQDSGGLQDIEFLVQYWILLLAKRYPDLLRYSDNVRQLEGLSDTGEVAKDVAQQLRDIYLVYRERLHRLSLSGTEPRIDKGQLTAEREAVQAIWQRVMEK